MQKLLVLYTSKTGNTQSFVDWFGKQFSNQFDITYFNLYRDKNLTNIEQYDIITLGSYTWANGKIPVEMKRFVIENRELLQEKVAFLFGSGITIYAHFCAALDSIQIILGKEIYSIKFELTFIPDEHDEEINKLGEILNEYVFINKK
ncbi:MAG: flavodoxin domain-containing protein [Carnobacterium sp.]|uniref:flavodoxin domain-containing protein n=1 Tax=Carnobacterium sp. TaxID=48221 RepID=UPI0033145E70